MALQHSTEYSLSTISDSGPWGEWVQQPEHAAEDVGAHSMVITGLAIGLYWARLRITPLPITEASTPVISQVFSFEVTNPAAYLSQSQAVQSSSAAASISYIAAASESQTAQTESAAGGIAFVGVIASAQALQTEQLLSPTNDRTGDLAESQAAQTASVSAAVITYATSSGAQAKQTEAIAVTYSAPAGDTTAPTVTVFTAGSPSGSTVPITTFTATDAVGVTGYLITESATTPLVGAAGWTGTAPTSYTATGTGSVALYAWAKDAAGNVSAAATQTVTIAGAAPQGTDFEAGLDGFTLGKSNASGVMARSNSAPIAGTWSVRYDGAASSSGSGGAGVVLVSKSVNLGLGTISFKVKLSYVGDGLNTYCAIVLDETTLKVEYPTQGEILTVDYNNTTYTGTHTLSFEAYIEDYFDTDNMEYTGQVQQTVWIDDVVIP